MLKVMKERLDDLRVKAGFRIGETLHGIASDVNKVSANAEFKINDRRREEERKEKEYWDAMVKASPNLMNYTIRK